MNEPMSFTVRNDYAFKKIFGSEENKDILTEFLCLVTGLNKADFEDLQIENTELQQKYYDSKAGRLDVKILLKNGQKIDIEMQNIWYPDFTKRSIYYWAEIFTEDFNKGDDYVELNKCIAINIINQPFPLSKKIHSVYQILETEEHTPLDEVLEIHFLDLSKIPQEKRNELENWLLFIQTDKQEVRNMIAQTNTTLEKANEQMQEFYSVNEQRALYIAAREAESDRVSQLSASRRQGQYEANCQTAKILKQLGDSIEKIAQATGLSEEEIKNLR